VPVIRGVAGAVGAAHDKGVVHRDLKPDNIFLVPDRTTTAGERIKLLDFGIAKLPADHREPEEALDQNTPYGTLLGTPNYMSPEQCTGELEIDERTDLYALGCIFFYMLTGRPPFTGRRLTVMRSHVHQPAPSPLTLRPTLPRELASITLRLLAKDPRDRFQTTRSLATALKEFTDSSGPVARNIYITAPGRRAMSPELAVSNISSTKILSSQLELITPVGIPAQPNRRWRWRAALGGALLIVLAATVAVVQSLSGQSGGGAVGGAVSGEAALVFGGSNTIGDQLAIELVRPYLLVAKGASNVQVDAVPGKNEFKIGYQLDDQIQRIEITASGSEDGFRCLADRTCNIGMFSRPLKAEEMSTLNDVMQPHARIAEHVLAVDGIAVIVNIGNPVSELSLDQVRRIFTGEIADWSQVSSSASGPISVMARDDNSGTMAMFAKMALRGDRLVATALRFEDSRELADAVSSDPSAIGFVGLSHLDRGSNKAVPLYTTGTDPLVPDDFTIASEEYLLARRLYLYAADSDREANGFIDFALSENGQRMVGRAGFIDQSLRLRASERLPDDPSRYAELVTRPTPAKRFSVSLRFTPDGTALDSRSVKDIQRIVAAVAKRPPSGYQLLVLGFADENDSTS
ncbi:MAG: substrate-binding domain-containing protein, partial [Myxococcota bacterium]